MSTHIHGSFLSGIVRHVGYRGLLSAQLTDEVFIVSVLAGTLVTIPLSTIQKVLLGQMPSDLGIKVYYSSDDRTHNLHLRVLNAREWGHAFQALGVPVVETPAKAFDWRYFLPMVLFVLLAGGVFWIYFLVLPR